MLIPVILSRIPIIVVRLAVISTASIKSASPIIRNLWETANKRICHDAKVIIESAEPKPMRTPFNNFPV